MWKAIAWLALFIVGIIVAAFVLSAAVVFIGSFFTRQPFAEDYQLYGWWVFGISSVVFLALFILILAGINVLYDEIPSRRY
ncbi:MAG TPA: hypothetical protein PLY16_01200, partial [Candidatus Saccharibacteria bacterium]|nr:hypothetical protein [Candidatus Saccharibacteria bacterium]